MPAIIAWVGAAIAWVFSKKLGQWIVGAMVFLGLQFAVNTYAVGPLLDQIKSIANGAGGDALGWIAFFNLDKYISIILSAYATAATSGVVLRKLTGGGSS